MSKVMPIGDFVFIHKAYPLSIEAQAQDLAEVVAQYKNKKVSKELQEICDKRFEKLFQIYLESKGHTYNVSYYHILIDDLVPTIKEIKDYYGRPRPKDLAEQMGIDFSGDHLGSAQTPSYPSGHTIQAYVLALMLSDQFPERRESLMSIAEMVSQSRIDRGVHFPTDIEHGREIAHSIHYQIKKGFGEETQDFKEPYS